MSVFIRLWLRASPTSRLDWPSLQPWLPNHPDIRVEISSDNRFIDIVAERFDIGVRLGNDVAKDMIAVRVAPDLRMAVAASPEYLAAARSH